VESTGDPILDTVWQGLLTKHQAKAIRRMKPGELLPRFRALAFG
jgi:hypothetical protein